MRALLLPLALLASATGVAAQDVPPDAQAAAGPRGTSGEVHDDAVGYASMMQGGEGAQVAVLHPTLPQGSFVEMTALDTGRTIVAFVAGPYSGPGVVALSLEAAQALGVGDGAGVRVRSVTPTPQEQAALRNGQPAGSRLDAPPTLLTALRRKLPAAGAAHPRRAEPSRPVRTAAPVTAPTEDLGYGLKGPIRRPAPRSAAPLAAPPVARGQYGVQVAALSAPDRAEALAGALGGHVVAAGRLYRVQLGPFADASTAARARDGAARAGYGDARVFPF